MEESNRFERNSKRLLESAADDVEETDKSGDDRKTEENREPTRVLHLHFSFWMNLDGDCILKPMRSKKYENQPFIRFEKIGFENQYILHASSSEIPL